MKLQLEWVYVTPKKQEVVLTSEWVKPKAAMMLSNDFQSTGRVKRLIMTDETGSEWTKKQLEKYLKSLETEPHDFVTYFDGGFDIETNRAGLGIVMYFEQDGKKRRIRKNLFIEEIDTNNEAEYAAIWFLLNELQQLGVHHQPITIKGDSQVVLNQLSGEWPCYEENLSKWIDRIEQKVKEMGVQPSYVPISRKDNKEADELASQALAGTQIASEMELKRDEENQSFE